MPTSPATSRHQGLSVFVEIDRDQAARFGITPATIDNALYDSYGQRIVSTIFTNSNQYRVILEADPSLQTSLQSLFDIYLPSSVGSTPVPLAVMAKMRRGNRAAAGLASRTVPLSHRVLQPGAGCVARRGGDGDQDRRKPRSAMPASVITSFQGAALAFQSSLSNQLFLILAAIVTVYIVLGVLYESFIHPLTILSTLPSAGIGALLALMMRRRRSDDRRHHRHHPADRHRQEKRDHDDRLRARRRAQRGQAAARGDLPGLPVAVPADPDDDHGGGARRLAA